MDYNPRIKLNVFEDATTYKNDYHKFIPDKRFKHTWPKDRSEPPTKPIPEFRRKDPATFICWKNGGKNVPFHLMIQPRPIIDTCPYTMIPQLEKPVDEGKEKAIKTRPRRFVSPAISMDDIPDPEMRKLVCQYMYTTDWRKAEREAAEAQPRTERIVPETTVEVKSDPVILKTDIFPTLPPGWRQKGKTWDDKQRRACVDATEAFWLNKDPPVKCGACINPYKGAVPQELSDEIAQLISQDQLRLPHDYPKPGYTGYQPRLSQGTPLSKGKFSVTHPLLSASQAIAQRYIDDKQP